MTAAAPQTYFEPERSYSDITRTSDYQAAERMDTFVAQIKKEHDTEKQAQ